jgi:hypothetical protein
VAKKGFPAKKGFRNGIIGAVARFSHLSSFKLGELAGDVDGFQIRGLLLGRLFMDMEPGVETVLSEEISSSSS